MAPAPARLHQEVAGEIFRQAANALEGSGCRVLIAPLDVRLPKGDEADDQIDTVVQPDILAVRDPAKPDARCVRGAPDWMVEVLSPATASHDPIHKRRIYERHGVAELWLVHPTDRVLTLYRLRKGEYGRPEIVELTGETAVGVLPGLAIGWDSLADRLPEPGP